MLWASAAQASFAVQLVSQLFQIDRGISDKDESSSQERDVLDSVHDIRLVG